MAKKRKVDKEEEFDGICDPDLQPTPVSDADIDGVVLFADIDPGDVEGIEKRIDEYDKLFGGRH